MNKLLRTGLGVFLFFYMGNYANAQTELECYKHVLVKLARDIDTNICTSKNGAHINILAKKLGIKPIMENRNYSHSCVAFYSGNLELKQLANKLDKNKDKIISLEELFEIY